MENNIENSQNFKNAEEQKHIAEIYSDKAINLLNICIGIFIFNAITYIFGILTQNAFDFGFVFETISCLCILYAKSTIKETNLQSGKKIIIFANLPLAFLIVYDFINLLLNLDEILTEIVRYYTTFDQFFYYLSPYLVDVTLIALIVLFYQSYIALCKADGSIKSSNYVDTFYDKL